MKDKTLRWSDDFSVGIHAIDEQHKRLLSIFNSLSAAGAGDTEAASRIHASLQEFENYTRYHFHSEDKLMNAWPIDATRRAKHQQAHRRFETFLARATGLAKTHPTEVAHHLAAFLAQWILNHMLGVDASMAREIAALQAGAVYREQTSDEPGSRDRLIDSIDSLNESLVERTLELLESSAKNEAFLKHASDGVHILDEDGYLLESSDQFCAMLGYTCEEMKGMHVSQWDTLHSVEEVRKYIAQQLAAREPIRFETRHRRKDGALLDVEINGSPILIQGKWVLFDSARDITQRKAMEAALQQSLEHQQHLTTANALLGEVNQAIARAEDEQALLQQICTLTQRYARIGLAWVGRPDGEGNFQVLAAAGETGYLDGIEISPREDRPQGLGPAGRAWREQRAIYTVDFCDDSTVLLWRERAAKFGFTSATSLSIYRGGDLWGVFTAFHKERVGSLDPDIQRILKAMAQDVGFGLDRIDLARHERAANAFNEVLLNSLTCGINVVRLPDRIIERTNQRTLEIFGATEEDLLGQSAMKLYRDKEGFQRVGDFAHQIMAQGSGLLLDVPFQRMDGTPIFVDLSGQKLPSMAGQPERIVWTFVDVTRRHQLMDELSRQSLSDRLTSLPNRRALDMELERAASRSYRNKKPLAVCMMDLDNFKPINDTYGHAAGDRVLQVVAKRLLATLRKTDFVARLGGDEFVLLLEGFGNLDLLATILRHLEEAVCRPIELEKGQSVSVGMSVGVCSCSATLGERPDMLLRNADQALYEAKAHKEDRSRFWARYGEPVPRQRNRYQRLLWSSGLTVFYQPIFDIPSSRIVGIEALARMKEGDKPIVSAAELLPHLNEADLFELTRQVLLQSMEDLRILDTASENAFPLWVSVNLAPSSLNQGCVDRLRDTLTGSSIDLHRITFELLEGGESLNTKEAAHWVQELRSLGVRIALDDVGSAYSSLKRIRSLPIDVIKLDQGYVRALAKKPENMQFITTIQQLAEDFGVELVVEGAESQDVLDALMALHVTLVQGYVIARPMPLEALREFLKHPPVYHHHPPESLLGVYADMISRHSAVRRTIRVNPRLVSYAGLDDVNLCPATEHLRRLGYPEGSALQSLHRRYHHLLACGYARSMATQADNDLREAGEAHHHLLAATLAEYRQVLGAWKRQTTTVRTHQAAAADTSPAVVQTSA